MPVEDRRTASQIGLVKIIAFHKDSEKCGNRSAREISPTSHTFGNRLNTEGV